ncbi:OmpA family protein [Acinetobacter sp. ANC 4648]|uniref:OmpA family protein n=1 Tax=Acinetobacter sp. ANC 4648 TaxID=1977875 RepID=UPI000A352913|nr:OmpA family protein [Acinetobacter sp. ANC 4648]OTG80010.1 hypothetical protein B9T27_13650 [Acinetobacter sp. ANC 4648]
MNLSKRLKVSILAIFCFALSGCLSFGSLSHKQVRILKKEGFVLTDEGWSLGLPERLLFDFNAAEIKPSHESELVRLAEQLKKYNLNKVKIVGHTDNVGNPEYNLKLSEQRAQTVAVIFLKHGFAHQNVFASGKGSTQPVEINDSEEHRAANRRVAVIIIP